MPDHQSDLAHWVIAQSFMSKTVVFDLMHFFFVGGIAAKQNYTDADIINFLTNVECLEGQFDTWGAFGFGFVGKSKLLCCPQQNFLSLTHCLLGMHHQTIMCKWCDGVQVLR